MKLVIKNMVCLRCKLMVAQTLKEAGVTPLQIELGEVTVAEQALSQKAVCTFVRRTEQAFIRWQPIQSHLL